MRGKLMTIIVAALLIVAGSCTSQQKAQFAALDPGDQKKVATALAERQAQERRFFEGIVAARERAAAAASTDCYGAMRQVWPSSMWSWAEGIIHRESTNNPSAANPRSSARGCWQLLSSLHADKYAAVGCHVSQWADAMCNTRAAYHLYKLAGTSPWRL